MPEGELSDNRADSIGQPSHPPEPPSSIEPKTVGLALPDNTFLSEREAESIPLVADIKRAWMFTCESCGRDNMIYAHYDEANRLIGIPFAVVCGYCGTHHQTDVNPLIDDADSDSGWDDGDDWEDDDDDDDSWADDDWDDDDDEDWDDDDASDLADSDVDIDFDPLEGDGPGA